MNSYYHKICKDFNSGNDLMKAIVSNRAIVYYYLSQLIILYSDAYKNIGVKEGKQAADQLLTETLLVFHRQVKNNKIELRIKDERIFTNKENLELFDYLSNLFSLIIETSPVNPNHNQNQEFEQKLVCGQGFRKIYEIKESILNTLHTFGCKDQQDKEEIFDESLLVFWKKLTQGEVGVYFTGNNQKLENCRVFNRKFYQSSKLGTFLTGISKNIFLNKTRTTDYQTFRNKTTEISEQDNIEPVSSGSDAPALTLFLFYRILVEERRLRTIISILQYDCNLEDKEVQQLIGINNTRIHSSRLRAHFSEWYQKNILKIPELLDAAHDYLIKRESKKEKLNEKISTIDLYRRDSLGFLDLKIFHEEFHSIPEFRQYYRIFKYVFYFTAVGKPSALAGLPDEKMMRTLMEIYKVGLYTLPKYQAILLLLYYGSDEPGEIIINLMKSLHQELLQQDTATESIAELTRQLQENTPDDYSSLKNEIYETNKVLFNRFSTDKNFTNLIYENEPAQSAF